MGEPAFIVRLGCGLLAHAALSPFRPSSRTSVRIQLSQESAGLGRRIVGRWIKGLRIGPFRRKAISAPRSSALTSSWDEIPQRDDARVALVAEHAQRPGAEGEEAAGIRRQAQPAGGENTQQMAVSEEGDVAAGG